MKRLLWSGLVSSCVLGGCMHKQQAPSPTSPPAVAQAGLVQDPRDVMQLLNNILAKYDTSVDLDLEVGEWEIHFKKGDCEFRSTLRGIRLMFRLENGVPKLYSITR